MIQQNQVCTVEFNNFRRAHRNRAGGEVFLLELEVTEDEWSRLRDFPRDAIGDLAIQWTDRTPMEEKTSRTKARAQQCAKEQAEEKKQEEQFTPEQKLNGRAWSALIYKRGFCNCPGVREALEAVRQTTTEKPEALLHRLFNVEHMRDVSPATALEMFDHNPQAELMIERAAREAAQPSKGPDGATVREVGRPDSETDSLGLAT